MPLDYAGNTLSTAKALTITTKPQVFTDWVDSLDTNDYYRFSLSSRSSFNLNLDGLSANADVQLIRDANNNSLVDSGEVLASSTRSGIDVESITRGLDAGNYYIRVYPASGNTNYNLRVWLDYAGNTLTTARNITLNSTISTYSDWVGTQDTNDYYRFSLAGTSNFSLSLNGMAANADVKLLDGNGNLIVGSYSTSNTNDTISRQLNAGTYYIQVYRNSSAETFYNLAVSTSPTDYAGNTLTTARNITVNSTTSTYKDWVGTQDTTDYYRFSLAGTSNFSLSLNGMAANADVKLLDGNGNLIVGSYSTGNTNDTISRQLNAGTYYIQVYRNSSAETFYNLAVSATPDWYSSNLRDVEITNATRSLAADGNLSRNDMIAIFRNAKDGEVINASELTDLRTLVSNASRFNMQDYVRVLSNKLVNGDVANQMYQGSTLGNLYAGSSATQMEKLISKWFLGSDRPQTTGSSYTYRSASGSLFQNGISYQDVNQGAVGDCYFLVGLAETAARSPSTIGSMFIDNSDGTFTVRFYNNGIADYVTVDRSLPTDSYGYFVYAHQTDSSWGYYNNSSNELWVALAEKAYAQINESGWTQRWNNDHSNSYQGINGGYMNAALSNITGRSTLWDLLDSNSDFNSIVNAFNSGKLIGIGTKASGVASNIVPGHAYALIGYNSSTQKFSLFNPWGVNGGEYEGNFKPGIIELSWSEIMASFDEWDFTTT